MNFDLLTSYLANNKIPGYRLIQLKETVLKGGLSYDQITSWPSSLITAVSPIIPFSSWKSADTLLSSDGTVKAVLKLNDGLSIETVMMEPKPGHFSVCLSSEVGCVMNCAFCATGSMGFKRRLTAEEITDQILFWLQFKKHQNQQAPINSIVFMGMGEPFHNIEETFKAIQIVREWYDFGARHISVSTSGIPSGIQKLANIYPQVNLAVSLHSANQAKRQELMPVAKMYPLTMLKASLLNYLSVTRRQIMFEYVLLSGINDRSEDQKSLIAFLKFFPKHLIHVNLIRYNQTYRGFAPTSVSKVESWKKYLLLKHFSVSIRKNLGEDINGACGQLAAKSIL